MQTHNKKAGRNKVTPVGDRKERSAAKETKGLEHIQSMHLQVT